MIWLNKNEKKNIKGDVHQFKMPWHGYVFALYTEKLLWGYLRKELMISAIMIS